jgi:hypothetical protein
MRKIEVKTGDRYNRLSIVKEVEQRGNERRFNCICDCGNETIVYLGNLRRNNSATTSCGCYNKEMTTKKNTTHGMKNTSEYNSWENMKQRCYNPNNPRYNDWGGRGIKVCDEWNNSFETFLKDMGMKPGEDYSIDRIDVNGNYEPSNCRWADSVTQNNNKRPKTLLNSW